MGSGSEGTSSVAVERFAQGLETYFTADAAWQLLDAFAPEGLLEDVAAEEAVDPEDLGRVIGRLVGRALAKEAVSYVPLGQAVEVTVGRMVGEKLGETAAAVLITYGNIGAVTARASAMRDEADFDRLTGPVGDGFRERAIRDSVPGLADTADLVWESDSATDVEIHEETNAE